MKKRKNLSKVIIDGMLIAGIIVGVYSCGNSQKPEDTKEVAEEHNEAKFDEKKTENDAQFLVNAAEISLMEIQLGQLASTNAMMDEVKQMGKMMESDHTKSLNELKDLATKKSITIPTTLTDDGQSSYKKISDKSGKDFDKEYCDMMVDGHKDAIDKFEKASNDASDPDIRQWASATLPALRTHLDHAIKCQVDCKKM
jgi:putative membrane protein